MNQNDPKKSSINVSLLIVIPIIVIILLLLSGVEIGLKEINFFGVILDIKETSTPKFLESHSEIINPTNTSNPVLEETQISDETELTSNFYCVYGDNAPANQYSHVSFSYSLEENQFINGQATEFTFGSTSEGGGVAYILIGPGNFSWTTKHGWWEICSNYSNEKITEKVDWQANSLEENGNTSTGFASKLICEINDNSSKCTKQ